MKFYVFIACSLSSLPNNSDSSLYVNYFVRDMNSTFWGFFVSESLQISEGKEEEKNLKKTLWLSITHRSRLMNSSLLYVFRLDWKIAFFYQGEMKRSLF